MTRCAFRHTRNLVLTIMFLSILVAPCLAIMDSHELARPAIAQEENAPIAVARVGQDGTVWLDRETEFNGTASYDPDDPDTDLTFVWTFNDDGLKTLTGMVVSYTFTVPGPYNIKLTVTDPDNHTDEAWVSVSAMYDTEAPVANAGTDRTIYTVRASTLIVLSANSSTDNVEITEYRWTFNYSGTEYTLEGRFVSFDFAKEGNYTVVLTVTDWKGYTSSDTMYVRIIYPETFLEKYWLHVLVTIIVLGYVAYSVWMKWQKDHTLMTDTDVEKLKLQYKSLRKTWSIFKANKLGFAGLLVLVAFVVMAITAPWISTVPDPTNVLNAEPNERSEGWENPLPPSLTPSPYSNLTHPFGTDHKGQDIYSLTMYGARASLIVGGVATLISVVVGAIIGLSAGYFGRGLDEFLMRVTDFFLVLPWFPLMIVMMAILGQKFVWVVVVIGITSWPSTARVVRSQVLTVKERQFIVRAKCIGAGDGHILKTHIMPNVLPLIFANTVLLIAVAIFSEAFLDFFGLGDPTVISWGAMLEAAYEFDAFVTGAWWWIAAPGAAIVLMVLAFSLVGYAIDDVLNPKLRRR